MKIQDFCTHHLLDRAYEAWPQRLKDGLYNISMNYCHSKDLQKSDWILLNSSDLYELNDNEQTRLFLTIGSGCVRDNNGQTCSYVTDSDQTGITHSVTAKRNN